MKRNRIEYLCAFFLSIIVWLTSCTGENSSLTENSLELDMNSELASEESENVSNEEEKIFLDTYEIRESESGKDVLLFTKEAFEALEHIDSENFTYEMLKAIVDNTIDLYQSNDTITIPLKEGSEYSDTFNDTDVGNPITIKISCPGDEDMWYLITDFYDYEKKIAYEVGTDSSKRFADGEKIVFKTAKTIESMDSVDMLVLREIIWLRLWYSVNSGCFEFKSFSGRYGGYFIIYLTNEADNYGRKAQLVSINNGEIFYKPQSTMDSETKKICLFPEWFTIK
ncbi:MAG: hypothetical protein E7614_07855 [Ruminococcaceae bacterium]|nr:hypothetical protein [Oscillospiraceae bacterium]